MNSGAVVWVEFRGIIQCLTCGKWRKMEGNQAPSGLYGEHKCRGEDGWNEPPAEGCGIIAAWLVGRCSC